MSIKHSNTTSDYIEWNTMLNLVRRLYKDGDYRMSLLIGCGSFFGLRISDLLTLNWAMLLDGDSFVLTKTDTPKGVCSKFISMFQARVVHFYILIFLLVPEEIVL